jgi:AcrR family transcriptional regulator
MTAEQRRKQILTVAAKMANDLGLARVSPQTVSDHIDDIGWSGVKYHFPNKHALHGALLDENLLTEECIEKAVAYQIITLPE